MNVLGKKILLRAIEENDLPLLRDMLNSPEMEGNVVGWSLPVSEKLQNEWYARSLTDQNSIRLIIDLKQYGSVGLVTLHDLNWKNRSASVGIKISNKYRSLGIGTDAVMAIMRYAFDELGLHRLESTVFDDNVASINLFKKCGWFVEGTKREAVYKAGRFRNLHVIGILVNDYRSLVCKTNYWNE